MANTWEQPQLHLAKPQKDYYTVLTGVKEFQSKLYLNNISEISFRVYEYENGERNELYDELEETQLIQALDFDVEWFQIATVKETKSDMPVAYKDISCNSLEDELITKTVYNLNGVFKLYNIEDTTKSIMHIITNDISWNIGYISPSIATLYRTLSIDSGRIYSLLTSDLSKSFNCIFKFNREYKTISAYTIDELGEETDIIISEQNLLKSWEKNSNKDNIVTKIRIIGGTATDGTVFDIRKVNFGSDSITCYDYFKPRMSSALQTALSNYENAIETNTTSYNTNIALLKTYNADLTTLNNQMTDIKSQIKAQDGVMNTSLKVESHKGFPPSPTDADYTNYINAVNQLAILNTQKANKQIEIDAKNSQIIAVNSVLENISSNIDKSKFFTSDLLDELDCFTYVGDDYIDDTFISTSETTSEQEIEMAQQLKANGEKELFIACKPQPEFKATLNNLWSIYDEKDCVISYDIWREKFKLGNLVTIMLNDDSWTTVRIIGIELNYDNPSDAEITFSSRTRLDNSTFNLSEIQAQASRAYTSINMNKYSWYQAASQTSSNEEFRNNVLTATMNKMQSDPMGVVEFGEYGIKCRDWIESEKAYGLNGMWLNPYRMIFTSDGFKTAGSAYGLLSFPDGTQHMGINAEYLMGKMLLTKYLYAENEAGNLKFDKDGLTVSATVGNNSYCVGLNAINPSEIFNIKVNNTNKFFIDSLNNRLIMKGGIYADTGELGDLTITGTLRNGNISGTSITVTNNLNTINISPTSGIEMLKGTNKVFYFDTDGNAVFSGNINASTITGSTIKSVFGTTSTITMELSDTSFSTYRTVNGVEDYRGEFNFQGISFSEPYPSGNYSLFTDSSISMQNAGGSILSINAYEARYKNSTIITSANISGSHMHSSYEITPITNSDYTIGLYYNTPVATPAYCYANFQPKSASDFRLKKDIVSLDDTIDEFFFNLKPKKYKFKDADNKIHIGLLAQEVRTNLINSGLDENYAIFDKRPVKKYTNECLYVDDEVQRVEYEEITSLTVYQVQKLKNENSQLKEMISLQSNKLDMIQKQIDELLSR